MADDFFNKQSPSSRKKKDIVVKYFQAWSQIISAALDKTTDPRICFADLYAGPGRYKDGTESIPLRILRIAIASPDLRGRLVAIFNDVRRTYAKQLGKAIEDLPGLKQLKTEPDVFCGPVDKELADKLSKSKLIPTLLFLDPWGYKGISLDLLKAVLKDWGCDIIFFFNYNRINPALNNSSVRHRMDELFGSATADSLRSALRNESPENREKQIMARIREVLQVAGGAHFLAFRFANNKGERTSHYLLFVSKHGRGRKVMTDIMAKSGWLDAEGFPILEFVPSGKQMGLFTANSGRLERLMKSIESQFAGRTLTVDQIIELHQSDSAFVERNYKDAIRELEHCGRVTVNPPAGKRPMRLGVVTLAGKCSVTIPKE